MLDDLVSANDRGTRGVKFTWWKFIGWSTLLTESGCKSQGQCFWLKIILPLNVDLNIKKPTNISQIFHPKHFKKIPLIKSNKE